MSDHRSKMSPFNDSEQTGLTAKQKKNNKRFHRKMQRLERNGYVAGQHKYNHHKAGSVHDQTLHQNGASIKGPPPSTSTQNEGLFYQASTASASYCSSRPSASTHGMLLEHGFGNPYIGVNMSDHRSKMSPFNDTEQRNSAAKQKKKNKWIHKKMQHLEGNDYVAGQYKYNHYKAGSGHDQTPHQNGASTKGPPPSTSTQKEGLFYQASTASASHCSSRPSASTHGMPSLTSTVFNQDSHKKPKEPVNLTSATTGPGPSSHKPTSPSAGIPTKYLAIDCEMVGVGPKGSISQLARCSIVSYEGDVVYDKFIKPPMPVTDYRTRWSGIRRCDLINATPYPEARKEILKLINGKVVIGHAIHNDFKVLSYSHANALTRDTSRMPLLNQRAGFPENQCASLKRLTKAIFNRDIQTGKKGHSSVEDARASLALYKVVEEEWERKLACKSHTN